MPETFTAEDFAESKPAFTAADFEEQPTPTGPPEVSTLPEQSVQLGGGRPAPPAQSFGAKSVWQNVTTPIANFPPEAIAQQLRFNPSQPAIGMALAALPPKLREDIIKGVSEGVAQNVVDPFLSPLGAGTMLAGGAIPKVAQKAMQIGFGVLGGMGVPGTVKRLAQAKTPGEASKELIGLGAETGMAVGGVKGVADLLPRTKAALSQVKPTTERPENATQERQIEEGVQRERERADAQRVPAETGVGDSLQPATEVTQTPNAPEGQARNVLAPASELDALQTIRDAGMPLSDLQQSRLSELEKAAAPPPVRPEGEPTRVVAAAATAKPSGPGAAVTAAPPAASVSEATTSQGVKQVSVEKVEPALMTAKEYEPIYEQNIRRSLIHDEATGTLRFNLQGHTDSAISAVGRIRGASVEFQKVTDPRTGLPVETPVAVFRTMEVGTGEAAKSLIADEIVEALRYDYGPSAAAWTDHMGRLDDAVRQGKPFSAEAWKEHYGSKRVPRGYVETGGIYRRVASAKQGKEGVSTSKAETGLGALPPQAEPQTAPEGGATKGAEAAAAQPDFVGLGAAAAGEAPIESQLTQLSRNIRAQSISPRTPFMERLKNALNISDSWSRGKDAVTRSVARLTAVKDSLVSAYMNEPPWRNYETSLGQWTGRDQQTALQVRSFQKDINRSIPDKLRQEAITNWIQAGGDEALLRERANASKGRLRQGYELALTLNDAEKTLARNIQSYLESMLDEGVKAGLLKQGVDNYVTQIWKRPNAVTQKMVSDLFGGGMLNPNFKFAKKRIFDSYFEGEQLGFEPKDKSIGRLVAAYDLAFNRALSARTFIKSLKDGTAADDKPIIITSGKTIPVPPGEPVPEAFLIKPNAPPEGAVTADGRPYQPINHWALRDWKWATKGPEGQNVFVQGDLLVHPDHYLHLKRVLGKSLIRKVGVGEAALKVGSFAKQTKLSLSPFHTVQEGIHSLAHRVNPINPPEIDLNVPLQKALVNHGLMIQDPSAYELFAEGSGGGGLVGKIPGLGKLQQLYTEMTFKDYIPRLKMAMAQDAFERNRTAYSKDLASGKITEDQLLALTARESNAAFGEQNYKMMGRSQTFQDFLRLTLLAPDFLEARFRFVGQALKPYGREQRIALGLMGATLWTASRIMNKALDNDYHWDKPFSIISGGKEYRLRTILGDVAHLVGDWRNFWYNRLSPITRTGVEAITSRDDRGIKRSSAEQFVDFLSWFKPIPFQTRPGEGVAQALLASAGAPTRAYSKVQEFYGILDKWKNRQTDPSIRDAYERERQETHATSQYQPLRETLNANDLKGALKEYNKLVAKGVDTRKIVRAMQPKPFMSRQHEAMMLNDLTPDERKVYDQAMAERVQTWQRFTDMLKNQ